METPLSSIPQLVPNLTSATMVDGSPRAITVDTGGATELLATVPDTKLRLMCSFGGHIMPRPHDKALTYSSGETRLVVVDRRSSLASLRSRLSTMLLNGRSFTLKYQLPNEDLDSLVTITTDEDLENMIEEYDRATSSATASATQRIRLFLFANKLETAATMGSLLNSAKSETWFVDALNQSGLLPRGLSDSAAVNNTLVNLDEGSGGETDVLELETDVGGEKNKRGDYITNDVMSHQEMHMSSMPDSPMLEPAGGSSSSSPSTANLPQICVRVNEDQRIEEQFAQMSFSNVQTRTICPMMGYNNAPIDEVTDVRNYQVSSGDDPSDPSVMVGYKKPPLPMQPLVIPVRGAGGYGLTSPDHSIASDTSISSATSFPKPMYYQDQAQAIPKAPITQLDTTLVQTSNGLPLQEPTSVQTTSHVLSQSGKYKTMGQQHQLPVQQPLLHQGVQYIPHPSQYIPVYSHQQQNYPVYVMSVPQSQQYVPARNLPLYPNSTPATNPRPEAAQTVYGTAISQNPQVHQIQQQQLQQAQHQYMSYSGGPLETIYFHAQHPPVSNATQLVSPYQSMTPAAAAAALADMSKQMALDNDREQHHMASSQPL